MAESFIRKYLINRTQTRARCSQKKPSCFSLLLDIQQHGAGANKLERDLLEYFTVSQYTVRASTFPFISPYLSATC